jgi:hypothetical protein
MRRPNIVLPVSDDHGREALGCYGDPVIQTPHLDALARSGSEAPVTFYQVPYRSLVPQDATNVLVARRLIDADEGAYGALRVMVNCQHTGQAAGVACALALRDGIPVPHVNPRNSARR